MTLCHTGTRDLADHTRRADIVVAAAGVPGMVTADMIRDGAVRVDVGVSRVDGCTTGDLASDVWEKAAWVTPNSGRCRADDPGDAAQQHRRPCGAAGSVRAVSDVEPRRAPQGRHHFHPPDPRDARDTPLRPGEAAALPNRPRPPRPWYAQITGQWPLAITLLGVAIGLAIVAASFWRRGITVVGLTLAGAAVLRLLLPDRVQGCCGCARGGSTW